MGRAPCCEKKGLKKGPWIPEEDQTLISYIQRYGQGNWRTLPKQAGLLRCGKSCRLRWTNYLRPGIKRGNFTAEEEDAILKLHQMLGNRWSAIAATLPGRTDNGIKNHWRTHLKKRLMNSTMMSSTNATETFRINDHQGDKTVEYHSLGEQPSDCTAIPKKESKFESGSNGSMGSEGNNMGGNAPDRKDPDLSNEDFWAEVLSETSFSMEVDGGFEVQSSLSYLLSPPMYDVTTISQAWGREDEDNLEYFGGTSLRSFGYFDIYEGL